MKAYMRTLPGKPAAWIHGLVVALALSQAGFCAQQKPPGAADATKADAKPAYALEIINGVFTHRGKQQEAVLANVVDALRDMFPDHDIVVSPELANVQVADLKLRPAEKVESEHGAVWRTASLEGTLAAIRLASGNRFIWHTDATAVPSGVISPGIIDPTTGLPIPAPARADNDSLYMLEVDPAFAQSKRSVEVFNLHGYLATMGEKDPSAGLEQIKRMVVETLATLNQDAPRAQPEFQFHSGASLLVVIGSPEAIEVARKIITALPYYEGPGAGYPSGGGGGAGYQVPGRPSHYPPQGPAGVPGSAQAPR